MIIVSVASTAAVKVAFVAPDVLLVDTLFTPVPATDTLLMVAFVIVYSIDRLSSPPISVMVITNVGLFAAVNQHLPPVNAVLAVKFVVLSDPVHVIAYVWSPAAARTAGTNAEPKSPASKPAVVIAVTSLFLMM
jgi:hypothetical protein